MLDKLKMEKCIRFLLLRRMMGLAKSLYVYLFQHSAGLVWERGLYGYDGGALADVC